MLVMPCPSSVWRRRCGVLARQAGLATLLAFAAAAARAQEPPCSPALARIVALPEPGANAVQVRRAGKAWIAAERDGVLCSGDSVRVLQYGQATLRLSNETTIRLDQGTTLTLAPPDTRRATLLEQLSGRLHVMTRTPRAFSIKTPFVNANVQGTEFAVLLTDSSATVAVVEGKVELENDAGSTLLGSGEQATATQGAAPKRDLVVRPADAVAWTLYFPAVFDHRLAGASAEAGLQPSLTLYRAGRVADALAATGSPPAGPAGATWLSYRAGLLLQLGRLDEAKPAIEQALQRQPGHSDAHALLAVVAVVENDKQRALELAQQAVREDPKSPAALIALSYAEQARFQLEPALARVLDALRLDPSSALAHARRAELELSLGRLDAALAAAQEAVRLDPRVAKTHSVLGFASLTRIQTAAARASFERAIALDPADPLPRLGLGLARIRDGELEAGRAEIEVAVTLDPGNSLLRSYLGKAYYEEKRDARAGVQFGLAIERDPRDPTPHLYGAVLAQAENRPVEALRELDRSITLNDNRAVHRSRLLLDQDLAARAVGLAYIYRSLGFDQLATLEALKSLSLDATDAAAHRFLADSYVGQFRSEAARVSELLQAQLRQPIGMNGLQPEPLRDQLSVVDGIGPVRMGGFEFTPLFARNEVVARLDVLGGSGSTTGEQLQVSGLRDSVAFSLVQYHQQTEGLRANNDFKRDLASAFFHVALTPSVRLQAELRDDYTRQGDLYARFDADSFNRTLRENTRLRTLRLGGLWIIDTQSDLVVSVIGGRGSDHQFLTDDPSFFTNDRERLQSFEFQYTLKGIGYQLVAGLSAYVDEVSLQYPGADLSFDTREKSAYALVTFTGLPWGLVPQIGLSYDTYDQFDDHRSVVNPKFGLVWALPTGTTFRAASFRTLKRSFVANQTLQVAQFAGFNQFFDDLNGTQARRVGLGLDQRVSDRTFVGAEGSHRKLELPGFPGGADFQWTERTGRLYAYHVFGRNLTATVEVLHERFGRPEGFTVNEGFTNLRTTFVPVGLKVHAPSDWSAGLKATGVSQRITYFDGGGNEVEGRGRFVVVDANVSWRLPHRSGSITLEARNIFDRRFLYQEADFFSSARVAPRRLFFARLSVAI